MPAEAVADTGPLIHLDEVGRADALHAFRRTIVPTSVADEVRLKPRGPGTSLLRARHVHVTRPSPDERAAAASLSFRRLTQADRDALAMTQARDCPLLTDDLDLRDAAKVMEVRPVGTVGLLVLAGLSGVVGREEAKANLESLLTESSLFVTRHIVDQAKAVLA